MTTTLIRMSLIFGTAGLAAALATAPGPAYAQASLSGDTLMQAGNIVGGRYATMSGSGDDSVITYSTGGAGGGAQSVQLGRSARLLGGDGDGPQVAYLTPASVTIGREAWLTGGGDDAQLLYTSPDRRR